MDPEFESRRRYRPQFKRPPKPGEVPRQPMLRGLGEQLLSGGVRKMPEPPKPAPPPKPPTKQPVKEVATGPDLMTAWQSSPRPAPRRPQNQPQKHPNKKSQGHKRRWPAYLVIVLFLAAAALIAGHFYLRYKPIHQTTKVELVQSQASATAAAQKTPPFAYYAGNNENKGNSQFGTVVYDEHTATAGLSIYLNASGAVVTLNERQLPSNYKPIATSSALKDFLTTSKAGPSHDVKGGKLYVTPAPDSSSAGGAIFVTDGLIVQASTSKAISDGDWQSLFSSLALVQPTTP